MGEFPVEQGYVWTSCASVENGNPLFWDDEVADALTGGPIAPPSMVSVWFRPHHWAPGRTEEALPLQVHFDLKERFGLPEAVMTDNTIEFHTPVRMGDVLRTHQVLRSVSDEKTTKLGTGRFWVIDVVYPTRTASWWRSSPTPVSATGGPGRRRARDRPRASSWRRVRRRRAARAGLRGQRHHGRPGRAGHAATGGPCTTIRTSPSTATAPRTSS